MTSYIVYDALEADADKDGKKEKADRNNDGMISTEEIKNVKFINLEKIVSFPILMGFFYLHCKLVRLSLQKSQGFHFKLVRLPFQKSQKL